jgi:hypothetical protein
MTNSTFNLTLDSCENCPKIVATFENVPMSKLEDVLYYAERGFRSVEVVSNETGEVLFNQYVCHEIFESRHSGYNYGEAIDYIQHIIRKD